MHKLTPSYALSNTHTQMQMHEHTQTAGTGRKVGQTSQISLTTFCSMQEVPVSHVRYMQTHTYAYIALALILTHNQENINVFSHQQTQYLLNEG